MIIDSNAEKELDKKIKRFKNCAQEIPTILTGDQNIFQKYTTLCKNYYVTMIKCHQACCDVILINIKWYACDFESNSACMT